MPVGAKNPLERLRASHAEMNELKNSPIMIVQNTFEALVGARLPWRVTQQVAYDSFVRHTFVFSNVPGPDLPVSLAGKAVTGCVPVCLRMFVRACARACVGRSDAPLAQICLFVMNIKNQSMEFFAPARRRPSSTSTAQP